MENKFVDTNIFLRYLTGDDPPKYERCRGLFKRAVEGELGLSTSVMVIAELIWTLLSYYKVPKAEVIEKVSVIVGLKIYSFLIKTSLQTPSSFMRGRILISLTPTMLSL